jgi:hypothetical protein
MAYSTVADLTMDEFKGLVKEVVSQTIFELLGDPDDGLELREEIQERLHRSLAASSLKTKSAQEVAEKLGLEW